MKIHNTNKWNKAQSIDKFVKNQINLLDLTPIPSKNWIKSQSWEIIKQNIKTSDHKIIVWGMALAATISLTVAAGIQMNLIDFIDYSKSKEITHIDHIVVSKNEELFLAQKHNRQFIALSNVKSKDLKNAQSENIIKTNIQHKNETPNNYNTNSNFRIPKINPYVTIDFQQKAINPEVGIDFIIYSIQNKFKKKNIKLGLSTEFIQTKKESKNTIDVFHFANLSFEKLNLRTDKGWALKTGILLNTIDSNFYSGTTLKIGFDRHFSKWLKAGPELIFTNQWKNIYPAITLSFG